MKRVGDLWPDIAHFTSLLQASRRAAEGKRRRADVAAFFLNLEPELLQLERELREGSYAPGAYRTFRILDPKPRQISAAPFRDRVVHHALTGVLEPIFERRFSPNSFACRVGKGTHAALERAKFGVARYRYCLRCDVRKYFASIDHEILLGLLERVIKCKPTLRLAATIIGASNPQEEVLVWFPGDTLFTPIERKRGLPLGNQTSQFFANVYLDGLDQLVDRQCRPGVYARYVDDFVVFDDSKERLGEMRAAICESLAGVRLLLHPGKSRVYRCRDGVTFLGWRLFPSHARLTRQNVVHTQRRLKRLQGEFAAGVIEWGRVQQSVNAWIAHAAHGDTVVLREWMLSRYPFRATGVKPNRAGRVIQQ